MYFFFRFWYYNHMREEVLYKRKKELFQSIKERGLLWSYDHGVKYGPELDSTVIEAILRYGDLKDIRKLLRLYGKETVKSHWTKTVMKDQRFLKTSYFLARVFFDMDVEADFFKGQKSDRERKLRNLAS